MQWSKEKLEQLRNCSDPLKMMESIHDIISAYCGMAAYEEEVKFFVIKLNTLFNDSDFLHNSNLDDVPTHLMVALVSYQDFDYSNSLLFKEWFKIPIKKHEFLRNATVLNTMSYLLGLKHIKTKPTPLLYSGTTAPSILFDVMIEENKAPALDFFSMVLKRKFLNYSRDYVDDCLRLNREFSQYMFAPYDIIRNSEVCLQNTLETDDGLNRLALLFFPNEHLIWDCQRSYAIIMRSQSHIIKSCDPLIYRLLKEDFWINYITTQECTVEQFLAIYKRLYPLDGVYIKIPCESPNPDQFYEAQKKCIIVKKHFDVLMRPCESPNPDKFYEAQTKCTVVKKHFDVLMQKNPYAVSTDVIVEFLNDEDYINTFNAKDAGQKIDFLNILDKVLNKESHIKWRESKLVVGFCQNNKQEIIDGLSILSISINDDAKVYISPYLCIIDKENIKMFFQNLEELCKCIDKSYKEGLNGYVSSPLRIIYNQATRLLEAFCGERFEMQNIKNINKKNMDPSKRKCVLHDPVANNYAIGIEVFPDGVYRINGTNSKGEIRYIQIDKYGEYSGFKGPGNLGVVGTQMLHNIRDIFEYFEIEFPKFIECVKQQSHSKYRAIKFSIEKTI